MAAKRKSCGTSHQFREHNIGAGLTRKICAACGLLEIGQGRRVVLAEDPWEGKVTSLFANAG